MTTAAVRPNRRGPAPSHVTACAVCNRCSRRKARAIRASVTGNCGSSSTTTTSLASATAPPSPSASATEATSLAVPAVSLGPGVCILDVLWSPTGGAAPGWAQGCSPPSNSSPSPAPASRLSPPHTRSRHHASTWPAAIRSAAPSPTTPRARRTSTWRRNCKAPRHQTADIDELAVAGLVDIRMAMIRPPVTPC